MHHLRQGEFLGHISQRFDTQQGLALIETVYHTQVYQGPHAHHNSHLTLFLQGGTFERRKHFNQAVTPGHLLFYYSGELHQNLNTQFPSKNLNLDISADFFAQQELSEARLEQAIHQNPYCRAILLRMYKEAQWMDPSSAESITSLAHQLVEPSSGRFSQKRPAWVNQLRDLLRDTWSQTPCLREIGNELKLNPITISKQFPRYFGCTLSEYSRRLKVGRAIARIRQPAVSLTALAYECGFADQSHFIRVFKEQTGFLPQEFQKF
ncbi:helix-turn-helix transcriptional regulator [Spirosoma aerolatum]|uniref:helix-turn-helix transcriptional regulator n=1 Tax=Spirosoma aerolatum TaxID=1211326 RepID=UPI0009ABC7AB|nr:helix-turn-helix transcriptional regulator [Spirosoma aerolatum]